MTISIFGVTAASVRAEYFPSLSPFSTSSMPTAVTVATIIDSVGADLASYLLAKGLSPSSIDATTNPNAYIWCADTIRLGVAPRIARAGAPPSDPKRVDVWDKAYADRLERLEAHGPDILGDAPVAAEESVGPRSHLVQMDLEVDDAADASSATSRFKKDDIR